MTDERLDLVLRRIDVHHEPPRAFADETLARLLPIAADAARRDRNALWRALGAVRDALFVPARRDGAARARRLAPLAIALLLLLLAAIAAALFAGRRPGDGPFVYSTSDLRLVVVDLSGSERILVPEGQAPVLSPDGRRVVYQTGRSDGLWIVNIDGTRPVQFRAPETTSIVPYWLADSQHLVLEEVDHQTTGTGATRQATRTCRTLLADANTGVARPVLDGCAGTHGVSPDGRYAATVVPVDSTRVRAEIVHLEGGARIPIGRPVGADAPSIAFGWSPTGDELAYGQGREVRFLDGTGATTRPSITGPGCATIDWSPNAGRLACPTEDGTRAWILPVDGSPAVRLAGPAFEPAWSPDGSTLMFLRNGRLATMPGADGPTVVDDELWLVDADGTHERRVATGVDDANQLPRWSRSGDRIAFLRGTDRQVADGNAQLVELWTVRPDGTGETRVAPDAYGFDW